MCERPPDLQAWLGFLQEYAQLLLVSVPHTGELLKLGVPDFRTQTLPGRLRELLDRPSWLDVGGANGPSADDHRRLAGLAPSEYGRWADGIREWFQQLLYAHSQAGQEAER